jgi:predicted Zn-dependent peptidase
MKSTTLNNGLEIITDKRNEDFVNIAYMIDKGSMDEPDDKLGIAHLTEHMVFKGTANRDKDQIWEDVSKFGGSMNAYTAENHTAFYCTILKEYWEEALDVLSDIVWNNTLPEEEFDLEKSVVVEELKMYSDEGKHVVLDLLTKTIFPDIENRWNNGGTPETVSEITREDVSEYIENYFIPKNIKIVITR